MLRRVRLEVSLWCTGGVHDTERIALRVVPDNITIAARQSQSARTGAPKETLCLGDILERIVQVGEVGTVAVEVRQRVLSGCRDGLAVLEGLQDDEQLGSEASALVARRHRRRAGGGKRRTSD